MNEVCVFIMHSYLFFSLKEFTKTGETNWIFQSEDKTLSKRLISKTECPFRKENTVKTQGLDDKINLNK